MYCERWLNRWSMFSRCHHLSPRLLKDSHSSQLSVCLSLTYTLIISLPFHSRESVSLSRPLGFKSRISTSTHQLKHFSSNQIKWIRIIVKLHAAAIRMMKAHQSSGLAEVTPHHGEIINPCRSVCRAHIDPCTHLHVKHRPPGGHSFNLPSLGCVEVKSHYPLFSVLCMSTFRWHAKDKFIYSLSDLRYKVITLVHNEHRGESYWSELDLS